MIDASPHRHATIDVHTEVSGWLDRMNWAVTDLYVSIGNAMATACRSAPNKLRLLCVQLQPIAGRPTHDVEDALRHVGLERVGIRRWGPVLNHMIQGMSWHSIPTLQKEHKQNVLSIYAVNHLCHMPEEGGLDCMDSVRSNWLVLRRTATALETNW